MFLICEDFRVFFDRVRNIDPDAQNNAACVFLGSDPLPTGQLTIYRQEYILEIYDSMVAHFPDINDLVLESNPDKYASICADVRLPSFIFSPSFTFISSLQLGSGRSKARADDYLLIKRNIGLMYSFEKPLPADTAAEKALCGFNNKDCADLLAPHHLDLSDPA